MTQSNELLPCPFCGSIEVNNTTSPFHYAKDDDEVGAWVCPDCCGAAPIGRNDKEATKAWNTRATPPQSPNLAVLDALKAVKSQAELLYGEDAKFNLFYIYAEIGLSANQPDDVKVIPKLEAAISEYKKDGWNIHDETLATLAIGAEEHLKRQKGR